MTISTLVTMNSTPSLQAPKEPTKKGLNTSEVESNDISDQKYSDVRCLNMFGEWRRCICESCSY